MTHPHPHHRHLIASLAALGLLLAACGGAEGDAGTEATPSAEATAAATGDATATATTDAGGAGTPTGGPGGMPPAPFAVTSAAFEPGGAIPVEFTCDGADTSIPLDFTRFDARTQTLAIILEDPDAPGGTFVHWTAWNIPPGNIEAGALPSGASAGANDFGERGYAGPCPPPGQSHRYIVTAYEVDTTLALDASATAADLRAALAGHIVSEARYEGVYPAR